LLGKELEINNRRRSLTSLTAVVNDIFVVAYYD